MAEIISYRDIIRKKIKKINKELIIWRRENEHLEREIERTKREIREMDARSNRSQFKVIK